MGGSAKLGHRNIIGLDQVPDEGGVCLNASDMSFISARKPEQELRDSIATLER